MSSRRPRQSAPAITGRCGTGPLRETSRVCPRETVGRLGRRAPAAPRAGRREASSARPSAHGRVRARLPARRRAPPPRQRRGRSASSGSRAPGDSRLPVPDRDDRDARLRECLRVALHRSLGHLEPLGELRGGQLPRVCSTSRKETSRLARTFSSLFHKYDRRRRECRLAWSRAFVLELAAVSPLPLRAGSAPAAFARNDTVANSKGRYDHGSEANSRRVPRSPRTWPSTARPRRSSTTRRRSARRSADAWRRRMAPSLTPRSRSGTRW